MPRKVQTLIEHLQRPLDLTHAAAILHWDQNVSMPDRGIRARALQLSTLSSLAHSLFASEKTGELLAEAEEEVRGMELEEDHAALVRVVRRLYDQETKLPSAFVEEESLATSQAYDIWRQAREKRDFSLFLPSLKQVVDLNRRKADYLGYEKHPYDALLQLYEPGITTAEVEELFAPLRKELPPLLREIRSRTAPPHPALGRHYPEEKQWEFSLALLDRMGFDFQQGRLDRSPHPFTTNFSVEDVRITTRLFSHNPLSSIFSTIHEAGHALYEMGIPLSLERTHLAQGATLGLHESQSRLWENQVGRSRAFWNYFYPIFRAFFPEQTRDVDPALFLREINRVEPGLIRVEADEVTYNLHIFVRFELEKELVTGALSPEEVPEAWNARYESMLGLRPAHDGEGCLQDVHWSHGSLGYFPTYTLGNLLAASLYAQAKARLPGLEESFAEGEFASLREWLREHVHRHGARYTARELMEREFGETLRAEPLLTYLREKYAARPDA